MWGWQLTVGAGLAEESGVVLVALMIKVPLVQGQGRHSRLIADVEQRRRIVGADVFVATVGEAQRLFVLRVDVGQISAVGIAAGHCFPAGDCRGVSSWFSRGLRLCAGRCVESGHQQQKGDDHAQPTDGQTEEDAGALAQLALCLNHTGIEEAAHLLIFLDDSVRNN